MLKPVHKLSVCLSDLDNLRASGLTDQTILAAGLRTEGGALVFPYRDLDGEPNGFARRRPHNPRVIDGRLAKYEQPPGSSPRAYFPLVSLPGLRDGKSPVYVTEGEKKALALSQIELTAVGIGGVWCGCKPKSDDLIDDLAAVPWGGRVVYIVFDYDAKPETREQVAAATARLTRALRRAGAGAVYPVELLPGRDGGKQGVDDFLVTCGKQAFAELVRRAEGGNTGIKIIPVVASDLGPEAYLGLVGQFLRAVAPFTEATDAGVLAHLLPAIGSMLGPRCYVFAGGKQFPRFNTALVGPTKVGRKGTSLAPVGLLMEKVDRDFWTRRRVNGLASGEGLVSFLADTREYDPETKETTETPTDKRVYVVEEELSGTLTRMGREGNVLSQIIREAFDGGNLATLTVTPRHAAGAHVCITGHITPDELRKKLSETEILNGFGNRFLWFSVRSDKVMPTTKPIPDQVFAPYLPRLKALATVGATWPLRGEVAVPLSPDAQELWNKLYPGLRQDRPGLAGAMTARGEVMILRVALVYALLDPAIRLAPRPTARPDQNLKGLEVRPEHLRAAHAVWLYCEESAYQLFGDGGHDPHKAHLRTKVLSLLDAGPMTRDEFNPHLSAKQKKLLAAVLAELGGDGLVKASEVKRAGAGRPATRWERVRG